MNDHEHSRSADSGADCPATDAVLAAFLDGATIEDQARLSEHRDSCPRCRQALDRTRELDALLAAETRTDIDEAIADRVLAFDAPPPVSVRARRTLGRVAAAAALLVAGAVVWIAVQSRPDRLAPVDPAPRRVATKVGTKVAAKTAPALRRSTGPAVIDAPTALRLAPGSRLRSPAADDEWDRDALEQRFERGPNDVGEYRRLVRHAVRLASVDSAGQPDGLRVAAVRWLAGEAARGRAGSRRLWAAAELLVQSRGALRRELVAAFREERGLRNLLGRPSPGRHAAWGARDRLVADAIGATGLPHLLDRVRSAPNDVIERVVAMARTTGDRVAVEFALDLCCGVVERGAVRRDQVIAWFADGAPDATRLSVALERRMHHARRRPTRELCRAILDARLAPDAGLL